MRLAFTRGFCQVLAASATLVGGGTLLPGCTAKQPKQTVRSQHPAVGTSVSELVKKWGPPRTVLIVQDQPDGRASVPVLNVPADKLQDYLPLADGSTARLEYSEFKATIAGDRVVSLEDVAPVGEQHSRRPQDGMSAREVLSKFGRPESAMVQSNDGKGVFKRLDPAADGFVKPLPANLTATWSYKDIDVFVEQGTVIGTNVHGAQ